MAFSNEVKKAIRQEASQLGVEEAALLAIVEVESGGNAFTTIDGKPMPLILYEYHVFYRWAGLTTAERNLAVSRKLAAKNWGDIAYPKSQTARYNLLRKAAGINEQAAYAACSWGVGQVLGENAEWLGYGTPKKLAEKAMQGIEGQLDVMIKFIKKRKLMDELHNKDWRGFARYYNGPGQVDYYSKRFAAAYKRHGGTDDDESDGTVLRVGMTGTAVAELQRRLRSLGYHLIVDGDFGPATKRQLMLFQADHDLTPDGIAGPATRGRLEVLSGGHV